MEICVGAATFIAAEFALRFAIWLITKPKRSMEPSGNGRVGDDAVHFTYDISPLTGRRSLRYAKLIQDQCSDETAIDASDLIAVFRAKADSGHEHTIVSIREQASTGQTPTSLPLQFLQVSGLPTDFVEAFESTFDNHKVADDDDSAVSLTFVISTASGDRSADKFFAATLRPLLKYCDLEEGRDFEVYHTKSEVSVVELAKTTFVPLANHGTAQHIVMLSGDGGVIDVVDALYASERSTHFVKPDITILPFGTGNALSNSYKYTKDNTMGLSTMFRGRPRALPAFCVTFSPGARLLFNEGNQERELPVHRDQQTMWGAVVFSWGLHASLVADSDTTHYRQFGAERFQMAAKQLLSPEDGSGHHDYLGQVSYLDPERSTWQRLDRDKHSYILATMVSNLEKTFTVSPDSQALDGKMRLVEMPSLSGDDLMTLMTAGYQGGQHVTDAKVGYREIDGLKIEFHEDDARWRRVCVDGKIVRMGKGGSVTIMREQESVLDIVCIPD